MEANDLINRVRSVKPGQIIRVTFANSSDGIAALRSLKSDYCGPDGIWVAPDSPKAIEAVLKEEDWQYCQNRTVGFFHFQRLLDEALSRFAHSIERVAIA